MRWLGYRALVAIGLVACGTSNGGSNMNVSGSGTSSAGSSAGGQTASGSTSGAAAAGTSGTLSSGATSGVGNSGASTSGAASGTSSSGASGGASTSGGTSGGSGSGSASGGASGSMASSGTATTPFPSGPSAGCTTAPPAKGNVNISIPSCAAGAITAKCISPDFQPQGIAYIKAGQYDFNNREFAILGLPNNYDGTTPFPAILEGGGCTSGPTNNGGGYNAGEGGNAIRIGLSYVAAGGCFADGGEWTGEPAAGFGCSPDEAHIGICVNNPEVPYVNAILDYLEAHFCVDLGKIFIGGYSSGAWEASTVSCALADRIRGMSTTFGGMRIHRAACPGPTAALMLAGLDDNSNPIGPMVMGMGLPSVGLSATEVDDDILELDSNGSAPMRDELLTRNGCNGTATTMYSAAYPQCMTYTGCPAAYPVVWCPLMGVGHGGGGVTSGGVMYAPAAWDFLSKLPTVQ
jgi:hypothetical protein